MVRRAAVPDRRAVPARRVVPPDLRAVVVRRAVVRRAVPPDLRAVVVFRLAVDLRAVEALRVVLPPERLPPDTAFSALFSASRASLRARFTPLWISLRMFAGSFFSCFSMLSSVVP